MTRHPEGFYDEAPDDRLDAMESIPFHTSAQLDAIPEVGTTEEENQSSPTGPRRGSSAAQRSPSLLSRFARRLGGSRRYEEFGDEPNPSAFAAAATGSTLEKCPSRLAAMRQLQYTGNGPLPEDDPRLREVRATFEANYGQVPDQLQQLFDGMPDRGLALMETYLYEHDPQCLPKELTADIAASTHTTGELIASRRLPISTGAGGSIGARRGSAANGTHSIPTLPAKPSLGSTMSPTRSGVPGMASARGPVLTRHNTINGDTRKMLQRMVSQNNRWSELAGMVMQVLETNLELAKQQKTAEKQGAVLEAGLPGLELSPSLQDELNVVLNKAAPAPPTDPVLPYFEAGGAADPAEDLMPAHFRKRVRVHWFALILCILYVCAFGFYIAFRSIFTIPGLGNYIAYGIFVLAVEVLGGLAIIPYAITSCVTVTNEEVEEIPADSTSRPLAYHVRVLVPCYKEPVDVIGKTMLAAVRAPVPPGCKRTVYLCDDSRSADKRRFVETLGRDEVVYVTGRQRAKGEMNGKSANLNHVLNLLYPPTSNIPLSEVICLFDADQICSPNFFLRMLPLMDGGRDVGMVLSPQAFYNSDPDADIFNHNNVPFWYYTQPGYDALNVISCTGTNFLARSQAVMQCGGFPTYTLTEDFALGIRLKENKWQCRYVPEPLAIGEAPEHTRNCFQQRSRWAKGHMQLFWSFKHSPLFSRSLGLVPRFFYCSVMLNYFSAFIGVPVMVAVPMLTAWLGVFPLIVNWQAATAITVYYAATNAVVYYSRNTEHLRAHWFACVSTSILWYAYLKALWRATFGRLMSGSIVFKVTAKGGKGLSLLARTGLQDVWLSAITFALLVTSFVIASIQLSKGPVSSPIVISMCWMAYNMVPPFLLMYYWTLHSIAPYRLLRYLCFFARIFSFVAAVLGIVFMWPLLPKSYGDYSEATAMTTQFYGSQMAGELPQDYNAVFPEPAQWRQSAPELDSKVVMLNASLTGNYTDWLLRTGYFDEELPLDVADMLTKLGEAASLQQTTLDALQQRQSALATDISETVKTLGTFDPSAVSTEQLGSQMAALQAQIEGYKTELTSLKADTVKAAEGATSLQDATKEVHQEIADADPSQLPMGRLAAHKMTDRLSRAATLLGEQATAMGNSQKALEKLEQSAAAQATEAAQAMAETAEASTPPAPPPPEGNRRRLLQANKDTPPPPPPPNDGLTDEEREELAKIRLEAEKTQAEKAKEEAERKASGVDADLRKQAAELSAALRSMSQTLKPMASDLTKAKGDLQNLAQTLSAGMTSSDSSSTQLSDEAAMKKGKDGVIQVKLEDVYSRSLWNDVTKYEEAALTTDGVLYKDSKEREFDLSGGYITNMGAANLKATTPIAFSTAMLSFSLLAFPDQLGRKVDDMDPTAALKMAVRHGADYLRKVHREGKVYQPPDEDKDEKEEEKETNFQVLISRVGFVDKETYFWTKPEATDTEGRPAFAIDQYHGASDLAGLVAGGLAAAACIFHDDSAYRDDLIAKAETVMAFGTTKMASMSDTDVDLQAYYNSTSFLDDLAWGAAWLARCHHDADKQAKWLEEFTTLGGMHMQFERESAQEYLFDWDHTFWGANAVLAQAPGIDNTRYPGLLNNTETFLKRWMCANDDQVTKSTERGLFVHPNATSTGVTANAAFVSAVMGAGLPNKKDVKGSEREAYTCWALSQVRYMLGDTGKSLVGGYGDDPPDYAQDPAAPCAGNLVPCNTFTTLYSPIDTTPPLVGALVTGPLELEDKFKEERWNASARVGIENNAGLTGALAGVVGSSAGAWQRCQQLSGAVRVHPVCGTRFMI